MPEPTAAPAALTGVEVLKADSNYLRDPLVAEFAAGGARISEDGYQILKFHGSYQQDDRDVRNDRRKAKEEFDYSFMIRLRLPGGDVHPELWRGLDELAGEFGRDALRLTTRQSIQLHFIPKAELRTVIRGVNERLASTLGACGDVNRNVMAAPLPAADARYAAVREAGRAISNHLLPRCRAYAELWLDGTEVAKVGPPDAEPLEDEPL
jgi:sulfite reductase beta subunit-like hemoprotein